jgi:hypothetical protein
MTDAAPIDVAAAVAALQPRLRRQSLVAIGAMTLAACLTVIGVVFVIGLEADDTGDKVKIIAFVLLVGGLAVYGIYRQLRKHQESLVMPIVASAVGLTYQKNAKPFLASLPDRLLPGQGIKAAEDHVTGQLGRHRIAMAEVKVETGGKNSRTLFKGVVAQLGNQVAMPAFFLAPPDQTRPGVIFNAWMPTDGLHHLRDVATPSGAVLGLWTSRTGRAEPPALAAVVKVLTDLETSIGPEVTLFSATSNGEEMHIALSHQRDLYRIGGLFPEHARLFSDVHAATRDLNLVLALANQLIAAEALAADSHAQTV